MASGYARKVSHEQNHSQVWRSMHHVRSSCGDAQSSSSLSSEGLDDPEISGESDQVRAAAAPAMFTFDVPGFVELYPIG